MKRNLIKQFISVFTVALLTMSASVSAQTLYDQYLDRIKIQGMSESGNYLLLNASDSNMPGISDEQQSPYTSLYLVQTSNDAITKVSLSYDGTPANGSVQDAFFIDDESVLFSSTSSNLVEDFQYQTSIFVYKISTGVISQVLMPSQIRQSISSQTVSDDGIFVFVNTLSGLYRYDSSSNSWSEYDSQVLESDEIIKVANNG